MATKAVQQFMLGTVLGSEGEARQTLAAMKEACLLYTSPSPRDS